MKLRRRDITICVKRYSARPYHITFVPEDSVQGMAPLHAWASLNTTVALNIGVRNQ